MSCRQEPRIPEYPEKGSLSFFRVPQKLFGVEGNPKGKRSARPSGARVPGKNRNIHGPQHCARGWPEAPLGLDGLPFLWQAVPSPGGRQGVEGRGGEGRGGEGGRGGRGGEGGEGRGGEGRGGEGRGGEGRGGREGRGGEGRGGEEGREVPLSHCPTDFSTLSAGTKWDFPLHNILVLGRASLRTVARTCPKRLTQVQTESRKLRPLHTFIVGSTVQVDADTGSIVTCIGQFEQDHIAAKRLPKWAQRIHFGHHIEICGVVVLCGVRKRRSILRLTMFKGVSRSYKTHTWI